MIRKKLKEITKNMQPNKPKPNRLAAYKHQGRPQPQASYKPSQPKVHPKENNSFSKMIKILYQRIDDSTGRKNAFYSPMSIALALAMVYEGTDKNLRSDFERILGFSPDKFTREESMGFLNSLLSTGQTGGVELTVGNSLWNADHCQLQPAFVGSLQTMFKAHCEALDLRDPEDCCDRVNGWIAAKTDGLITDMLTPESFPPDLLLI